MANSGPGPDPSDVDVGYSDGDHTGMSWKDEGGISHRVSWDGNGDKEHYTQSDGQGTKLIYDYDTGRWVDKSKQLKPVNTPHELLLRCFFDIMVWGEKEHFLKWLVQVQTP